MARVNLLALCVATLLFGVLSVGAIGLLDLRMDRTGNQHFAFLTWNLFLAWVPYAIAVGLYVAHRRRIPSVFLAVGFGLWILFLPNAPYILTDFIHLRPDSRVPLWYDFVLIGAFAGTGLLLGFASVYLAQSIISERLSPLWGWTAALALFALSGVGVYVGRVLRWNSWDAIHEPETFAAMVLQRLEDPLGNPMLIAIVVLFTAFLASLYLSLYLGSLAAYRGARVLTRKRT